MAGGTIIGNKAIDKGYNKEGKGGGVYVDADGYLDMWGKFTMEGGTIEGNIADQGGGVFAYGNFKMDKGTITKNKATMASGGNAVETYHNFEWNGGEIKDNDSSGQAVVVAPASIYINNSGNTPS